MAARWIPAPNLGGLIEGLDGVQAELEKRGQQVADETEVNSLMAQGQPGRYGDIEVSHDGTTVTVAATGSFAHLDEWGSVNNSPTAAMRRAAEAAGRFKEE